MYKKGFKLDHNVSSRVKNLENAVSNGPLSITSCVQPGANTAIERLFLDTSSTALKYKKGCNLINLTL